MEDDDAGVAQKCETYSCARCRRLKKKCPKQLPVCMNCQKADEHCLYPGRAPRRTKKELEEAKLRGEYLPAKRRKQSSTDIASGSDSNTTHSTPANEDFTQSRVLDAGRAKGNNAAVDMNLENALHSNTSSATNLEGVASLVSVLGSMAERSQLTPSSLHTVPSPVASFLGTSHGDVKNHLGSMPLSSVVRQTPQEEHEIMQQVQEQKKLPALRYIQGKLEHELHKPDSIPVRASSIQIEAVTGIFKGGRTTPWATEDGKFKLIERSLYDRFIAAYFKHNHKSFFMMDKIAFLNKVSTIRDFTAMDNEYEDSFIFQLYMAMAIGCTTLQRAEMLTKDEEGLSEHFAYLAMKKFCSVVHQQNIETIKCLLLLGIFALFEPKGVSSWTISGLIMRLAIGLGFNRALSTKRLKNFSGVDAELRYRVFWSAYCFERLVCTSLGRMSAIDDEEITVPLPSPLDEEEREDLEVTNMIISLRRMSGRIYKKVHSVGVGRKNYDMNEKLEIINALRKEVDDIYSHERSKIQSKNAAKWHGDSISFHSSDIWLAMRYAQLHIMLYRPSVLIPKPSIESLSMLGDFCLKALKHTYTLYKKKLLPLNWITLFRTLTICNTILYCLCQWSIDLVESKFEIQQCVEILQHFGEKWVFATKCAEVFQNISNTILDISLSTGNVSNMDKLTRELFGASDEYQEILDENNVDVSWIDKLI